MRRRLLLAGGGAALVLLAAGGAALGYVLYVRHEGRDIRGSSTQEFVPSVAIPTLPAPPKRTTATEPATVDWPFFGLDAERLHDLATSRDRKSVV